MNFLNVYFKDEFKSKHELNSLITRIGRKRDNDVVIDNAGVSGYHAEIIKTDDKYAIHDLDSKNGVFVNGERISDKALKIGDEIGIFKHKLRFVVEDVPTPLDTTPIQTSTQKNDDFQSATVEVDLSKLEGLLKQNTEKKASLTVSNGSLAGRQFKLAKSRFSFGKALDCDFQVGSWFAPKVAAKIVHQSDGYYLVPEKRGKVKLNGKMISNRTKITDGSVIEVRDTSFHFGH